MGSLSAAATAFDWTQNPEGASRHINQCEQFAETCQNVNPNTFISLQMNTRAHTIWITTHPVARAPVATDSSSLVAFKTQSPPIKDAYVKDMLGERNARKNNPLRDINLEHFVVELGLKPVIQSLTAARHSFVLINAWIWPCCAYSFLSPYYCAIHITPTFLSLLH